MRVDQAADSNQLTQHRLASNGNNGNGVSSQTNGSAHSEANGFHTPDNASEKSSTVSRLYHGHDREEFTRMLLQSLNDLGYRSAAEQLSKDSGYELELPRVAAFRDAVLRGALERAEFLLLGTLHSDEVENGLSSKDQGHHRHSSRTENTPLQNGTAVRQGLPLVEGVDSSVLRFTLRQQKYLEYLEKRDLSAALHVLRTELTPLKCDVERLHFLSSLMMCSSAAELRNQADWDGTDGTSRADLLSEISRFIAPSIMIPRHRLATLLGTVQDDQIQNCRYHNTVDPPSLFTDHECSADDFPLDTYVTLGDHMDEVWFLAFSNDGSMLATASKDGVVCIYDTIHWRLKHKLREHEPHPSAVSSDDCGVCCVAFSPDDQYLISCGKNRDFVVVSTHTGERVAVANHFDDSVTAVAWLPDSQTFVVGSHASDRSLGLYSLRQPPGAASNVVLHNPEIHTFRDPPVSTDNKSSKMRVTDCAVNASGTLLAITTTHKHIILYSLDPALEYCKMAEWIMDDSLTSINFSKDEELLLINMNEGRVLALDAKTGEVMCRYEGAVQKQYFIRSAFGGAGEAYVISGSEDSNVYIWRRQTGAQLAVLEAHQPGTVNAVAWHPTNPAIFASAGDDRQVRIWMSVTAQRHFDSHNQMSAHQHAHSSSDASSAATTHLSPLTARRSDYNSSAMSHSSVAASALGAAAPNMSSR